MGDEYYLLKRFSSKIPMIVTGTIDIKKSSEVYKYGAVTIMPKPFYENFNKLSHAINEAFLQMLAMPFGFQIKDVLVKKWCQVLREKKPNNIFSWAVLGGVSESCFRERWMKSISVKPDYFLYLYHLFLDAISYCENQNMKKRLQSTYSKEYRIDRQRSYYRVNHLKLNEILGKLSGCNFKTQLINNKTS
jgi:hypothetical protein